MEGRMRGEYRAPKIEAQRMAQDTKLEKRVEQRELDERRYNIDYIERWTTKLFTMQYGTLPPDHPAQRAIEESLTRCRKDNANLPNILVLPEWKEVNAAAIGKNTIIVSLELMKFCRTHEALVGVVGHERQHLETGDPFEPLRKEASKKEGSLGIGQEKNAATRYADEVGRSRLFEVRSDLQGATAKLDEAGVNPIGYREFLRDLDTHTRKEAKHNPDIVHGSPADRMLAIGFLMRYFDFSTSSNELTPIDTTTKEMWSAHETSGAAWAFRSTMDAGKNDAERIKAHEARIAWFETLPFEEQIFCLGVLHHRAEFARGDFQEKQRREAWLKHADNRVTKTMEERLREANPEIAKTALGIFKGLVLGDSDCIVETSKDIGRRKSAKHYAESISAILPHAGDFTFGGSHQLMRVLGGTYPETTDDAAHAAWLVMVNDTARVTCTFFEERASERRTQDELVCDTLRSALTRTSFFTIPQEEKNHLRDRLKAELAARGQSVDQMPLHIKEMYDDPEIITRLKSDQVCKDAIKRITLLTKVEASITAHIDRTGVLAEQATSSEEVRRYFKTGHSLVRNAIAKGCEESRSISQEAGTKRGEHYEQSLSKQTLAAYDAATEQHSAFANSSKIDRLLARFSFRKSIGFREEDNEADDEDEDDERRDNLGMAGEVITALGKETDETALRILRQATSRGLVLHERHELFDVALQDLSYRLSETPPDQFFARMDAFAAVGTPPETILRQDARVHGRLVQHLLNNIDAFATRGEDARALGLVATLSTDPWIAQMMRRAAAQRAWKAAPDFSTKVQIAFDTEHASINLAERVIERDMKTETQVAEVRSAAKREIDDMFTESARVGWLALSEQIDVGKYAPLDLLDMLLKTQKNDRKIKDAIADHIFMGRHDDAMGLTNPDSHEYQEMVTERLATADVALRSLYALDKPTRLFVIKRLLVDSGVIREKKTRTQALEMLLSHVLPEKEKDADLVMRTWAEHTIRALADVEDWETVFYAIGPLLADRICLPCEEPVPWNDIYQVEAHIEGVFDIEELEMEDLGKITKDTTRIDYARNAKRHLYRADIAARSWLRDHGLRAEMGRKGASSLELVRSTAERLGALPVRWLQVGKHYVKFSPEHEKEFSGIFNEVESQTKLAAVSVVEREWPEMWEHIRRFGNRIGGGSLMSVYKVDLFKGGSRAMRVCNPNIQTNLGATSNVFRETVKALAARGVLKADQRGAIDASVDLVEEWIRRDISFEDSRARDTRFHNIHNDRNEGTGYRVRIPIPDGPESRFFQMDEFVEGLDLTDWDELAKKHDMRKIVGTLARNFGVQIATGLLHPDLHPGNIRITDANELVYLDRSFLLDLTPGEQMAIGALLSPQPDIGPLRDLLANNLGMPQRAALDRVLAQTIGAKSIEPAEAVRVIQGNLRDIGVRLPLSLTLLMRNADAIDSYAKKAGLRGIAEALTI